ncbi:MAG: DUF4160 domain-containing protein [Anaerolineae bacterium]|nr:DUF4160 domain-containing protein [Anaerolineae bacterium]
MAPTILRQEGYQFIVFTHDHLPAHVHVRRAGNLARVKLDPVEVMSNYGFNTRELSKILEIVRDNQALLLSG